MAASVGTSTTTGLEERQRALDVLRRREHELRARGLTRLALFGSTARGDMGPESDIDLLIEVGPERRFDLFAFLDLKSDLAALPRRPRVFTGLMRCGVCGGGVATWNRLYVGCVNARNKGTCTNKTTMRRDDLETAVLEGLQHRLMDPDLMAVFCAEYTRHMNALTREHNAAREGAKVELARVNRDFDRLVQALLDGAPARTVKDRMAHLEARKDLLEAQLAEGEDAKITVHSSMASVYRERVANLRDALAKEGCHAEAAEIMRTLIDKIELTPVCRDGKATLSITLHGDLAGILGLAAKATGPLEASDPVVECTKLLAGAGNHRQFEISALV